MIAARAALIMILAVWIWVTSATTAAADPITATVSVIGAITAAATFVVNNAIYAFASWGMSRISRALSRGRDGAQERQATVTTLSLGETPREAIVGRAVTGGSLIDAFNFGGEYGTDTVVRVIALADHEVDRLEGIFVDDAYQGFGFSGVQLGFNGKLDIEFVNASAAGGVPPTRFASAGGWTAADKLIGITHVWVATTIDEETWTGHPTFRFLVRGAKLYNPALDAALGYEGPNPHVWADPSTHAFTENATVIEYNYRRGIYVTGRHGQQQHLLLGRGLTAEEAPPEAVLPWIALCDELVGGEPRYRAAGVISTADGHDVVAQWLADAMAGQVVQREGGVEVEPGHAKAPVMTITDGDLVVGEKVTFNAFSPDGSTGRYNTVIPRYVEPDQGWQDHSGPVRRDLDDIAEDGGPRELTLPLPLVTWGPQADRCAEIRRRRERLERSGAIVLPPRFAALEEGDWIAWQSDRRHDGATVIYQVEEAELGPNWRQYLVLREISAEVFDDADGLDDDADPQTPTPQPDAVYLTGVSIYPVQMAASETGAVQPSLRFSWSVPVDAAIVAIRAEVRLRGATDVAPTTTEAVNDGSLPVTQGVLSGSWLEARLVPVTRTTRAVVPSPWELLRVGQGVSDDLTPTGPGRRRLLNDQLDEARARFDADLVAEAEAEANEVLTRDLVDVVAEVNPVQRRALLRGGSLDIDGSSLDLLGVATRSELGLGPDGDVLLPLSPGVIGDSDLVVQLELSDAVDGLEGQIGLVASDVVSLGEDLTLAETTLQGEIDAVELTVGGHTTDLTTLGSDLTTLSGDLAAAEAALQGEIDAVELTVGGHTTHLATLGSDLAAAETALGGEIDALDAAVAADLLALEVALEAGSIVPLVAGGLTATATKALASGGEAPIPVKWFEVQAAHGETVGFDRDYGAVPIVLAAENNILPTPTRAGEYLNLTPSSITGSDLTGRALMVYPGTDPVYADQLDDDPSGKGIDATLGVWAEFQKATDTVAFNGQYTATVEVRLDGEPAPGSPTQSTAGAALTLGLYGRRTDAGAWVKFGEATYYSLTGFLNVLREVTISGTAPPEWGTWNTHSATEYRVQIEAGGETTYRRVTDFIQVEYTYLDTPGSGAESNPALPSGQKITYLVFPRG